MKYVLDENGKADIIGNGSSVYFECFGPHRNYESVVFFLLKKKRKCSKEVVALSMFSNKSVFTNVLVMMYEYLSIQATRHKSDTAHFSGCLIGTAPGELCDFLSATKAITYVGLTYIVHVELYYVWGGGGGGGFLVFYVSPRT